MSQIIEEQIFNYCKAIGDMWENLYQGTGDEKTPNTAAFFISQMKSLADNNLPQFGAISSSNDDFKTSIDYNKNLLLVNSGQIAYNGNKYFIKSQYVPINRTFSNIYSMNTDNWVYGLRIGMFLSEIQKSSQVYYTTTSQNIQANSQSLYVNDNNIILDLGFPIQAYIGNNNIVTLIGYNKIDNSFTISNNSIMAINIPQGTRINLIYESRITSLAGLPVNTSNVTSTLTPNEFEFHQPIPKNWIEIANVLIKNPNNPTVVAISETAYFFPSGTTATPLFSSSDAKKIQAVTRSAISSIKQNASSSPISQLISGLEEYTASNSNTNTTSFRQFWANQPFKATSTFGAGFNIGISSNSRFYRFAFPPDFINAYYGIKGVDLNHTFAIFNGELYNNGINLFGSPPAQINTIVNKYTTPYLNNGLSRGYYTYGITSITSQGESKPTYVSVDSSKDSPNIFSNEIIFPAVQNALCYHVYRIVYGQNNQLEYRLTKYNELTSPSDISTSSNIINFSNTANYSKLPIPFKNTANEIAFNIPNLANGKSLSGLQIYLSIDNYSYVYNRNDSIKVQLALDNSGSPGTVVAESNSLNYSNIKSPQSFIFVFNKITNLSPNTPYWVVLIPTSLPAKSLDDITNPQPVLNYHGVTSVGQDSSIVTNTVLKSYNQSWSTINSSTYGNNLFNIVQPIYKLIGFIDSNNSISSSYTQRGIYITRDVAKQPQRLSVFVPLIDSSVSSNIPDFGNLSSSNTSIRNQVQVTVVARNGESGNQVTLSATIDKGTPRGTRILLGNSSDLFDRVDNVYITPGSNLTITSYGQIDWSVYDLITVETVP